MREFETDVRVQLSRGDLIEHLVIQRRALLRLGHIRHVFAEVVDADAHVVGIRGGGGGECIVDRHAGDETARKASADSRSFGNGTKGLAFRESDENRAKHQAFATTAAQTRAAPAEISTLAHARSVSPVVQTSSTSRIERPPTWVEAANTPRTFDARS